MPLEMLENVQVGSPDADTVLVRACLEGDEQAWESMVKSYSRRIFNICLRFMGNREEAEDLTQEIFVRIYRSLGSFRSGSGSFQCWILSVSKNLAIDHYRRKRRARCALGSDEMATLHLEDCKTPSPSAAFEQGEASRLLVQALFELSPDLRKTVILRDLQGLSYQTVAGIMGVSQGTVKSRLFRARAHLAKMMVSRKAAQASFHRSMPETLSPRRENVKERPPVALRSA